MSNAPHMNICESPSSHSAATGLDSASAPTDCASTSSGNMKQDSLMRRNESAAAQLQYAGKLEWSKGTGLGMPRKNKSSNALSELGERERSLPTRGKERSQVLEAVVFELRVRMSASTTAPAAASDKADEVMSSMRTYIETIVRQLDLPNSCIIAMLIYVERAIVHERFELTNLNWQPCLLASFVVAAKLCFDEPVWNEDFVKALRISNVPVAQISKWEASFLQLIEFNTNVVLNDYVALCFRLQQRYQELRGERVHFFNFLMAQAQQLDEKGGKNS